MRTLRDSAREYDEVRRNEASTPADLKAAEAKWETALHDAGVYELALLGAAALRDMRDANEDPEREFVIGQAALISKYDSELLRSLHAEPTHQGRMDIRTKWARKYREADEKEEADRALAKLAELRQKQQDDELDRASKQATVTIAQVLATLAPDSAPLTKADLQDAIERQIQTAVSELQNARRDLAHAAPHIEADIAKAVAAAIRRLTNVSKCEEIAALRKLDGETNADIAKHLPRNLKTGKPYTREGVRQMLIRVENKLGFRFNKESYRAMVQREGRQSISAAPPSD